ncbi:MAG: hypothetical protein R3232_03495 [Clostridia bacterium]|jgi:uncharacterized protein YxeA|nr:hypothetical protein [Clostridia bacterium]
MKRLGIILLVLIVIGALMWVTNPTTDNFENFLERKASRNIQKYTSGSSDAMNDLEGNEKPPAVEYYDKGFGRKDYYVLSFYRSKSLDDTEGTKYLGVFKIFILME